MRDFITEALKGHDADYIDIRIEERQGTRMSFRGRDLEEIGENADLGGGVRALRKGGWGFVCFNDLNRLRDKVAEAVAHAGVVGHERSQLAEVAPVVDVVPLEAREDPRAVSLADKKQLMDQYNDLLWGAGPNVQTTRVSYADGYSKKYFANSQGSYIQLEKLDIVASFAAMARQGDDVQQGFHSTGSLGDFGPIRQLHREVREAAERAVRLLSAAPVKGGEYTVVLDPRLAGIFAHEAFGHLSEADFIYENPRLQEVLVLGRRFGEPLLNIGDGAAVPGLRGSFKYDDEGTPAQITPLIKEGVLVGRLHSRETAGQMNERPTGNARAISFRYRPIVRMTNTFIEPGNVPFEEMIGDIKEGVYAKGSFGGQTAMEMFSFSAAEAFMIRNGAIAEPVRGVLLSGNVFVTLGLIDAIGNDVAWGQGGGCGKGGQMPLPVSEGSPHVRIRKCVVGGR